MLLVRLWTLDGHSLGGRGNVFWRFPWFSRAALFWAALKASPPFFFFFFDELFSSKFSSSRISFSGKTHLPSLLIYVFLLVNYSEVRLAFPSFCFFFARLGVFFKSSIQWRRHSKCKVFPKTPWFEKKKFIYNNLKFFIYLLFKKNRNTLKSYLEHS